MNNVKCLSKHFKNKTYVFKSTYETEMFFIRYLTLRDIDKKLFNRKAEKRKLVSSFVRFLLTEKTFELLNDNDRKRYNIIPSTVTNNEIDFVLPNYSFENSNNQFHNDMLLFGLSEDDFETINNYIKNKIYNTHKVMQNVIAMRNETFPNVSVEIDNNFKKITFKYDTFEYYIHMNIYRKLCNLYFESIEDYENFRTFNLNILHLLFIYCGIQGYGYQRSSCKLHGLLPNTYFELFASPLNIEHPCGYCSVFPEIEEKFGSYGSFMNVINKPQSLSLPCNSFIINPPFINVIFEMLNVEINQHIELWKSNKRECEILYYSAYWDDFEPLKQMSNSKYVIYKEIKPVDYFDHNTTKIIKSKFDSIILKFR